MRKTIQQAIVETAQGLREAGVMGEITLRELKALSLPPVRLSARSRFVTSAARIT